MDLKASDTLSLQAALRVAHAGDNILLAPGQYDNLALKYINIGGQVTIESEDPNNMAQISGINIKNSSGLVFEKLNVINDTFYIEDSDHLTIDGIKVVGSGSLETGPGIKISTSNNITVENSDISHRGSGIANNDSDTIFLKNNFIHDIGGDGIDNGGSSHVTITGNTLTDFHPLLYSHPDAIQFWTSGTSTTTHDVVVTDNVIFRGAGDVAQGIFMNNEANIQYQNVTISGNYIIGDAYNGIYVEDADHAVIANNVVQGYSDMVSWIYLHNSTNSSVTGNETTIYKTDANPALISSNNTTVDPLAIGDTSILRQAGISLPSTDSSSLAASGQNLVGLSSGGTLQGGSGNDTITGGAGQSYLRGGVGDDKMVGGASFDDMNGNEGNDTLSAGGGDDWVLGGKGNDNLFAGDGNDLVYGNLGNDTLDGGAGADIVRGGQGDDQVSGGTGNDWLSGDLGVDTMTGGAGADIFHSFSGAGKDVVTDFNVGEGDRVQLDPGTSYTYAQGADGVVISLGGGDELTLLGVKMASLTSGWIFVG